MMKNSYLTIQELTHIIKYDLENDYRLKNILVKGEISNLKIHTSGHWYFTLKDARSRINAVMFASNARNCRFKIEEGMQVIVTASITVYELGGSYQLLVSKIEPDGIGLLYMQFEQLKAKLQAEGLFNPIYKKKIPAFPMKIGVISASTGAAIHDIFSTISRRWPICERILIPSLVQGVNAAQDIAMKLEYADTLGFDVIILARGGGSLEDLWPFNEEIVARSIFKMKTPIVSGVGHEVDFTISDFVADKRAPTPTGAAEMVTPNINEVEVYLDSLNDKLNTLFKTKLNDYKVKLDNLKNRKVLTNTDDLYKNHLLTLHSLNNRFNNVKSNFFTSINQNIIRMKNDLNNSFTNICKNNSIQISNLNISLNHNFTNYIKNVEKRFALNIAKLDAYSPLKILSRGYGVISDENNNSIKSIKNVNLNDKINIKLSDGLIKANVDSIKED